MSEFVSYEIMVAHNSLRKAHFDKINRKHRRWSSFDKYTDEMNNKLNARHPQYTQAHHQVYNGMVKHYSLVRHDFSKSELEKVIQGIVMNHFLDKEQALTTLILESE